MNNQMRDNFEAALRKEHWPMAEADLTRLANGNYNNTSTQTNWNIWQAAIASQESIAKPELPVKTMSEIKTWQERMEDGRLVQNSEWCKDEEIQELRAALSASLAEKK